MKFIYEQDEAIRRGLRPSHREPNRGFARMTTYMIGLFVVVLCYGLFWNNRSARSYADNSPVQPVRLDDPVSKLEEGAARTGHRSKCSV